MQLMVGCRLWNDMHCHPLLRNSSYFIVRVIVSTHTGYGLIMFVIRLVSFMFCWYYFSRMGEWFQISLLTFISSMKGDVKSVYLESFYPRVIYPRGGRKSNCFLFKKERRHPCHSYLFISVRILTCLSTSSVVKFPENDASLAVVCWQSIWGS